MLTIIGITIMLLLTATKLVSSSKIAGYSVFVGIAFFFIVEAVAKIKDADSGLRFKSIIDDIKKPGVLVWMLLPIGTALLSLVIGNIFFGSAYISHVYSRTDSILSFDKIPLLIFQLIIAAWGEEIAFRGFFVGKSMRIFPFWACAAVSSLTFAAGHIATGNAAVVIYDVGMVFVDSIIYSMVYRKSGNCMISTFSHILCNATGLIATSIVF